MAEGPGGRAPQDPELREVDDDDVREQGAVAQDAAGDDRARAHQVGRVPAARQLGLQRLRACTAITRRESALCRCSPRLTRCLLTLAQRQITLCAYLHPPIHAKLTANWVVTSLWR